AFGGAGDLRAGIAPTETAANRPCDDPDFGNDGHAQGRLTPVDAAHARPPGGAARADSHARRPTDQDCGAAVPRLGLRELRARDGARFELRVPAEVRPGAVP